MTQQPRTGTCTCTCAGSRGVGGRGASRRRSRRRLSLRPGEGPERALHGCRWSRGTRSAAERWAGGVGGWRTPGSALPPDLDAPPRGRVRERSKRRTGGDCASATRRARRSGEDERVAERGLGERRSIEERDAAGGALCLADLELDPHAHTAAEGQARARGWARADGGACAAAKSGSASRASEAATASGRDSHAGRTSARGPRCLSTSPAGRGGRGGAAGDRRAVVRVRLAAGGLRERWRLGPPPAARSPPATAARPRRAGRTSGCGAMKWAWRCPSPGR